MVVLNLTKEEANTLKGILLVEEQELIDLIDSSDDAKDKKELEGELKRVQSIKENL